MTENKPISIRFNAEERGELNTLKDIFGYSDTFGADSATIKTAISVCGNVIQNIFGGKLEMMFRRKAQQEKVIQAQNKQDSANNVIHEPQNNS